MIAPVESERYVALAELLALCVGVARAVFGLARLGWVAYLMSQPVVRGSTTASALLIIASQLPSALGAPAPAGGEASQPDRTLVSSSGVPRDLLVLYTAAVGGSPPPTHVHTG